MNDDIERLLKIVETVKEDPPLRRGSWPQNRKLTNIRRFIDIHGIQEGPMFIPFWAVFDLYITWAKEKTYILRPLTRQLFGTDFGKIFKIARDSGLKSGYYLDPSPFDLTPDGYFKARRRFRDERKRQKRKKEKAKSEAARISEEKGSKE